MHIIIEAHYGMVAWICVYTTKNASRFGICVYTWTHLSLFCHSLVGKYTFHFKDIMINVPRFKLWKYHITILVGFSLAIFQNFHSLCQKEWAVIEVSGSLNFMWWDLFYMRPITWQMQLYLQSISCVSLMLNDNKLLSNTYCWSEHVAFSYYTRIIKIRL